MGTCIAATAQATSFATGMGVACTVVLVEGYPARAAPSSLKVGGQVGEGGSVWSMSSHKGTIMGCQVQGRQRSRAKPTEMSTQG